MTSAIVGENTGQQRLHARCEVVNENDWQLDDGFVLDVCSRKRWLRGVHYENNNGTRSKQEAHGAVPYHQAARVICVGACKARRGERFRLMSVVGWRQNHDKGLSCVGVCAG